MKILICHERFLFRYGADRVLLLLARGLLERGHRVTLAGNRFDREIASASAARVIEVPGDLSAYLDLNEATADWLRRSWENLFDEYTAPDVVIVGGWPFLASIPIFRHFCPQIIFLDQGVVPNDGYSTETTANLNKLRLLRSEYLPHCTSVVAVSEFILHSQTRKDAGPGMPAFAVLNGSDHLASGLWAASRLPGEQAGRALRLVRNLKAAGKRILLCLGRWEPGCYKNSEAAFEVLGQVLASHPTALLCVLESEAGIRVPASLSNAVIPLGFPDDSELAEVMLEADVGFSVSLWEGFNLPLAEMQQLGRPALVFGVGAHPEVVAHPWFLCRDAAEMAAKVNALLEAAGLEAAGLEAAVYHRSLTTFRETFTWKRFVDRMEEIVSFRDTLLLIDVTNSTKDPANSGVIRVTRRLSRELQQHFRPLFVIREPASGRYVLPTRSELEQLSQFNGPCLDSDSQLSPGDTVRTAVEELLPDLPGRTRLLLIPEIMTGTDLSRVRHFARSKGFSVAAVFHDAIPVLRPDLYNQQIRDDHGRYMRELAGCDLTLPVSQFSADCLRDYWSANGIETKCRIDTQLLPGEFAGAQRVLEAPPPLIDQVRILCVSTLEPRKNHKSLIEACLQLQARHPDLNWSLTLIGNRYAGAFEIAEWVERAAASHARIRWMGIVDDATLVRSYQEASFTVYPSTMEGFGLPILESIWHSRPCICNSTGVMAELAGEGGCLTVDVTNVAALANAIYQLGTDLALQQRLSQEAVRRPIKTWAQYGEGIVRSLRSIAFESPLTWREIVYGNCLEDRWRLNDSERMALLGLLTRLKPGCSIEVGTGQGGSLSLIAQFSRMVFSIDIDPEIPGRFPQFENASFLTGDAALVLPHLFNELNRAGIAVEFILLADAQHSAEKVTRDIDSVLDYVPSKPMFVMVHGSFNPECRQAIRHTNWSRSRFCHWVDLDFIPGRIVEQEGSSDGELGGGFAAAYFHPTPRSGNLQIQASADKMFQSLRVSQPSEHLVQGREH